MDAVFLGGRFFYNYFEVTTRVLNQVTLVLVWYVIMKTPLFLQSCSFKFRLSGSIDL